MMPQPSTPERISSVLPSSSFDIEMEAAISCRVNVDGTQEPGRVLNALGRSILGVNLSGYTLKPNYATAICETDEFVKRAKIDDSINDRIICKICYINEYDTLLVPCGHMICGKCWDKIQTLRKIRLLEYGLTKRQITLKLKKKHCQICKTLVTSTQKPFF